MRIADLRWTRYRIPFKRPLVTAHGVFPFREGAIVEITDEDSGNTGVGEIAPPPGFGVSLDEALMPLREIAYRVKLYPFDTIAMSDELWHSFPAAARFAWWTAIDGVLVSRSNVPVRKERRAPVNATVSSQDIDEAAAMAQAAITDGFRCVKLKVGMAEAVDAEVARVAAVRGAIGPDAHLRLDANEAWDFRRALAILREVAAFDIQFCEQPLDRNSLYGMRRLRQEQSILIAADEAVKDRASVQRILDAGAADVLVLKPQCIGHFAACWHVIRRLPRSVGWVWSSSMESGIGVTATLAMAFGSPSRFECGLATLNLLEDDLIVEPPRVESGDMIIPEKSGRLDAELDREALARYAV